MKRDQTNVHRRVRDTPTAVAGAKIAKAATTAKVATAEAGMRAKARAKARVNTRAGAVTRAGNKAGAKDRRLIGASAVSPGIDTRRATTRARRSTFSPSPTTGR